MFVVIIAGLFSGCAATKPGINYIRPETGSQLEKDYIIQVGDVMGIKFYYTPELNENVTVRPDGKISLQLIDEVLAAGLTPSKLDDLLTEKYSKILEHSEVTVIMRELVGQRIYVGGEVNSPGMIPASGRLTSLQAIFRAGGFKNTAELKSIVILRNEGYDKPLFMTVNLAENLKSPYQHHDILLKPYDIIFVPKTKIAMLNQFVDQYIKKVIPVSMNVGFSWVHNLKPEVRMID